MKIAGAKVSECAARLAVLLPRERLEPEVVRWSDAFSGGPDSVALLLLLWAHWPERRRGLRVLHFNHRLRGAESRADLAFCRRMAKGLNLEFVAGAWAAARPDASEAEARAARMVFLQEHAHVIWLGHQQDDVAETMLMRLARGSGTGGLAAPRPIQRLPGGRRHVRPLLTLKKEEIVGALRQAGISWREDSSNAGEQFFRNRIRRRVIPLWAEAAQRDALAGAARSRMLLEEDDAALERWLDELNPFTEGRRLAVGVLAGKPRALWRRALHRWLLLQPRAGEISRPAFDALLAALERGVATRHSLGRHGFAKADGRELWFEPMRNKHRKFLGHAN